MMFSFFIIISDTCLSLLKPVAALLIMKKSESQDKYSGHTHFSPFESIAY